MPPKKTLISLFCMALFFSNCITVFSPKTQNVTIKTNNAKSTVTIDGKKVGTGSIIKTKILRNAKSKQIIVETPGCKTNYHSIVPTKLNDLLIPSLAISIPFYFPYALDMINPKTYLYRGTFDAFAGKKKKVKETTDKYIDVSKVTFDIKEKGFKYIPVGYSNFLYGVVFNQPGKTHKEFVSSEDFKIDNTIFSSQLSNILKKHGYIDTINQIFKDQANSLSLTATIKTLTFYIIYSDPQVYGLPAVKIKPSKFYNCKSDIEWKLLNSYGEVLNSVNTVSRSGSFVNNSDLSIMIGDMVESSLDIALSHNNFTPYLPIENIADSKMPATSLVKPTNTITNSADVQNATVIVKTEKSHGSGFAITNDGYIITNYHVIASEIPDKPYELSIILNDGTKQKATVVKYNKFKDLALLKIDKTFNNCFELPTQKNYTDLEEVFAMGAPQSVELGQSAAKGIISSERNTNNINLIQTNMSVNSGNSGGPMFNKDGKLYGVVTSKLFGIGVEGVAFCIPAYKIQDYLNIELK